MIDVVPEHLPPFGECTGFVLVIKCNEHEYPVSLRECPLEGGRRLWADILASSPSSVAERGCWLEIAADGGGVRDQQLGYRAESRAATTNATCGPVWRS